MATPVLSIKDPSDVFNIFNNSRSFWTSRDEKISRFRDLVRQIDRTQKKKSKRYHQFESNEPGTFFASMVQLLTRNPVSNRIPIEHDDEAQRRNKAEVEDLVMGTFRDVDRQRVDRIVESNLQTTLSQFALSDGWSVCEVVTHEDEPERPYIDIRTYDPLDVAFEWTDTGATTTVLHTTRSPMQVVLEYPKVDMETMHLYNGVRMPWGGVDSIDVYSCYYRKRVKKGYGVYYGVVVNNQWAIVPYLTSWKTLPVVVQSYNGLPFRADNIRNLSEANNPSFANIDNWHWTQDVGRGIFFANEKLYSEFNELWSMILDFVDKEARNTYWKRTKDGNDNDMEVGKGTDAVNALSEDEEIGRLPPGSMGNELMIAFQQLSGALQRGGISWQLTGQVPPGDLSGFAINQLISAALTVATPYVNGLTAVYQRVDQLIVEAYKNSGLEKVRVNVVRNNSFLDREIDLKILQDKTYYFDVKLKPGLPDDLAERIGIAINAKKGEILDDWTILDQVVQVEDPELIMDRQTEQAILNMPNVRLRRAAIMMVKQGRMDEAMAIMMELQMYQAGQQVQMGQAQVQLAQIQQMLGIPAAPQTDALGNGGAGPDGGVPPAAPPAPANPQLQGQRTGMPSDILPPEMAGVSPAAARDFAGALTARMGSRAAI